VVGIVIGVKDADLRWSFNLDVLGMEGMIIVDVVYWMSVLSSEERGVRRLLVSSRVSGL
jgi:hypothetical protein